jgi:fluoride ion exporter CrcB/FEX
VGLAVLAGGALGGVARSITDGMFVQYFKLFFFYQNRFFDFIM